MTCGRESTIENFAASLQTQRILLAVSSVWVSKALKVRKSVARWYKQLDAKKRATEKLVWDYQENENCLTATEWDAFVKGDEFKLAHIKRLTCSGKRGASQLTGSMIKRFIDAIPVSFIYDVAAGTMDVSYSSIEDSNFPRLPLKYSRKLAYAIQAGIYLKQATVREQWVSASTWARANDVLDQWEAESVRMANPPDLSPEVNELFSFVRENDSDNSGHNEYCECELCMDHAISGSFYRVRDGEAR